MKIDFKKIIEFTIYCLVTVVSSSLLIFLISEILGAQSVYDALTDLGSFFAGLIGLGGVVWLIYNQNISTQKTVNASMNAVHEEIQESRNRACDEYILDIVSAIDSVDSVMKSGAVSCADSLEFINIAQAKIKRLRVLSGKNDFEVNNLVIEGYIDFYRELLVTYDNGLMLGDDAAKALKDLNKKRVSLCGYLEHNKSSFINGVSVEWYWIAIKMLSQDICMLSNISNGSKGECEISELTVKGVYYLLNGIKIQLEYMISSRVSNPFIGRDA